MDGPLSPASLQFGRFEVSNRTAGAKLFGLVAIRMFVGAPDVSAARADVSFGGHTASFPAAELAEAFGQDATVLTFHVNTHLVANGEHEMGLRLVWDGAEHAPEPRVFEVFNDGQLAQEVAADLRAFNTPAIFGAVVDSTLFPYETGDSKVWFDKDAAPDVPLSTEPATSAEAALAHLHRWGFCVLHETLPQPLIDEFLSDLEVEIDSGRLPYRRGSSDRIHNAHRLPSGRNIWLFPPVLDFLARQFKDSPCACQTLTYVNGSEQSAHQDTIHLTPYPAGYMCGVWIALEDVQPNSGELFVYPGSHKTPRLRAAQLGLEKVREDYSSYHKFDAAVRDLLEEGGFERLVYMPKAGQILVWSENLVHGGSPRGDLDLTRKSIVSHYFAKGAVAYYDSRGEAGGLESIL